MKSILIFAFALLFVSPQASAQELKSGTLTQNGTEREYFYYIPSKALTNETGLPLLIALHGGGGNGKQYSRAGYTPLAEREGFIVVYPSSLGSQWNDGRPAEDARRRSGAAKNADDVGYIAALIDEFVQNHGANPDKVFVEGTSNGGMMVQRLAYEIPQKLKGAASVIASMPLAQYKACNPSQPVGMLLMSGTDDPLMPYDGGEVTVFGRSYGTVIGFEQTTSFWAQQNACRTPPESMNFKDANKDDGTTITLSQYQGCHESAPLWVYTVNGGGHTRPGLKHAPERRVGKTNMDLSAPVEIWKFFKSL